MLNGFRAPLLSVPVKSLVIPVALTAFAIASGCKTRHFNPISDAKGTNQEDTAKLEQSLRRLLGLDGRPEDVKLLVDQWFSDPLSGKARSTEDTVVTALRLKKSDRARWERVRGDALAKAKGIPDFRPGEPTSYAILLRFLFEDKPFIVEYVKQKAGYYYEPVTSKSLDERCAAGKSSVFAQGTPDKRFQSSFPPILMNLDRDVVEEVLATFPSFYDRAYKKFVLPNRGRTNEEKGPLCEEIKPKGQGGKRLVDTFHRYTTLPEQHFYRNFQASRTQGRDAELAAGEAYEKYLTSMRLSGGFRRPVGEDGQPVVLGNEQGGYGTPVITRAIGIIQQRLAAHNAAHADKPKAFHVFGGSLPRGTATLKSSDIDGFFKIDDPNQPMTYLGELDSERTKELAAGIKRALRAEISTEFQDEVEFTKDGFDVADEKMHRNPYVRSLTEFNLSEINPILFEVAEDRVCIIIHTVDKETVSNEVLRRKGVMVFPAGAFFETVSLPGGAPKPTANRSACHTRRREPGQRRP